MDLKTEQLIKSRLGLILKVLLIAVTLFKLSEYIFTYHGNTSTMPDTQPNKSAMVDTVNVTDTSQDRSIIEKGEPMPHSAGVYIFGPSGLDRQASRHIGDTFFKEYKRMAIPSDLQHEALLSGNFESAANTEWVCVGTIDYHFDNDGQKTTCEVRLNFDTYSALTGEKVQGLSQSILRYGIGFSNSQAKSVALEKIHP
ncbi:hypothetical protein [Pareuzebyella sediminis]|uniref:hypothetical protein n=1 Tax=Pareuzebyella sediminis TaxID=2607998 RepID=UPI0011EF5974|nr:hypothetical protein [Pareuzebyella sediminis]